MTKQKSKSKAKAKRPEWVSREGVGSVKQDMLRYKGVGVPNRFMTKLRYLTRLYFSGSTNPANQQFRINSLFDPDYTGTGVQPQYFDQMAAMYNKYLVTRCDYKLQFVNGNGVPICIAAAVSDIDMASVAYDDLASYKISHRAVLGGNSSMNVKTFKGSVDLAKLHGQVNIDADPDQYSLVSANPNDPAYLCLAAKDLAQSTSVACFVLVELVFHAVFKERINQVLSLAKRIGPSVHSTIGESSFEESEAEAEDGSCDRLRELEQIIATQREELAVTRANAKALLTQIQSHFH